MSSQVNPVALPAPSSRAELELRRFGRWAMEDCTDDQRRLLTLLIRRFGEYSNLGTAAGRRAQWIREQWPEAEGANIEAALDAAVAGVGEVFPFKRLKRLEVGPFRGFAEPETIDVERPVTFFYGPNGTGKSSFCEALEYAMLGFIEEAKSRRIDLEDYVRHVPTGQATVPRLLAEADDGTELVVGADPEAYRFCFIEKNRIDAFARMSATTPAAQAHRIASLFGLEEFNRFVDDFTENFDRYLELAPGKPAELAQLEEVAETHRRTVTGSAERRSDLSQKRGALAATSGLGVGFGELSTALFGDGTDASVGRLTELDGELESPQPFRREDLEAADVERVQSAVADIQARVAEYSAAAGAVAERGDDVSFARLFEAVRGVRAVWPEPTCPACLTPLATVVVDPQERAESGLVELAELAELETARDEALRELSSTVLVAQRRFDSANQLAEDLIAVRPLPSLDGLAAAIAAADPGSLEDIEEALRRTVAAEGDLGRFEAARTGALAALRTDEERRTGLRAERERLRSIATEMARLETEELQITLAVETAEEALRAFGARAETLKGEIAKEAARIEQDQRLLSAYDALIGRLRGYRDMLPMVLVEDLGEKSLEIYNQINAHDPPFDLLDGLVLPQKVGEDLLVHFAGAKDPVDALQMLSEGHLRCLGVAILLAKNLDENCGLVVFDDVVNAVDDDHRAGLAAVLMTREDIAEKQVIITTHGQEFVRTLSLQVPKEDFARRIGRIDFVMPRERRGVLVDHSTTPAHYLVRSAALIDEAEWRDALSNHRRGLEAVCAQLWKRLAAKYAILLKVSLRRLKHPPDLRSVVDALNGFLKKTVCKDPTDAATAITGCFDALVDRWDELNKATHEEEGQKEFEPVTVAEIQKALEDLESLVAKRWKEL